MVLKLSQFRKRQKWRENKLIRQLTDKKTCHFFKKQGIITNTETCSKRPSLILIDEYSKWQLWTWIIYMILFLLSVCLFYIYVYVTFEKSYILYIFIQFWKKEIFWKISREFNFAVSLFRKILWGFNFGDSQFQKIWQELYFMDLGENRKICKISFPRKFLPLR